MINRETKLITIRDSDPCHSQNGSKIDNMRPGGRSSTGSATQKL